MTGKRTLRFGKTERKVALNWQSLLVSFVVAILGWVSSSLIPELRNYEGIVATIAGAVAQIIPVVILYLRNNEDIQLKEKKDDQPE